MGWKGRRTEFLLGFLEAAPPFGSTEEVVEDSATDHDGANPQNLPPIDLAAAGAGGRSGLHNGHSGVVHLCSAVFLLEKEKRLKESKRLREGKQIKRPSKQGENWCFPAFPGSSSVILHSHEVTLACAGTLAGAADP
jgi:hypothetical protein